MDGWRAATVSLPLVPAPPAVEDASGAGLAQRLVADARWCWMCRRLAAGCGWTRGHGRATDKDDARSVGLRLDGTGAPVARDDALEPRLLWTGAMSHRAAQAVCGAGCSPSSRRGCAAAVPGEQGPGAARPPPSLRRRRPCRARSPATTSPFDPCPDADQTHRYQTRPRAAWAQHTALFGIGPCSRAPAG
jgi:hypothetical protein